MKKIGSLNYVIIIALFSFFLNQIIFADVLIRKDTPGTGSTGGSNTVYSTMSYELQTSSTVTVDLIGTEIMVNFNSPVGVATVTVQDKKGNMVYQTTVDTDTTAEVAVPVDGLSKGDYTVTVVYGSTSIVEVVSL